VRLIGPHFFKDEVMPHQSEHDIDASLAYLSTSLSPAFQEEVASHEMLLEADNYRHIGDRPSFVLTAMAAPSEAQLAEAKITSQQASRIRTVWRTLQDDEATWSSRSKHQLVNDSTHYIQFYRPDIVIEAVLSIVKDVRASP
jgi:hypothetical protein